MFKTFLIRVEVEGETGRLSPIEGQNHDSNVEYVNRALSATEDAKPLWDKRLCGQLYCDRMVIERVYIVTNTGLIQRSCCFRP